MNKQYLLLGIPAAVVFCYYSMFVWDREVVQYYTRWIGGTGLVLLCLSPLVRAIWKHLREKIKRSDFINQTSQEGGQS